MSFVDTIRVLGIGVMALAITMVAPLATALAVEPVAASAYVFSAFIAATAGGAFFFIGRSRGQTSDVREALLAVIVWWLGAPVFGALPFLLSGFGPGEAYFEAVSALTTTGAWLSEDAARAGPAAMVWRAALQWLGGLASLTIAAAIFIQPVFVGVEAEAPSFARREEDSYFGALENSLRFFAPPYALFTLACWLALSAGGASSLEASVAALSMAASGGFVPNWRPDESLALPLAASLLPFVLFGGASFLLLARIGERSRRIWRDRETGAYLVIIVCLAAALFVLGGFGGVSAAFAAVFNAASLMSTNGFLIGEAPNFPLALVAVVIGGCAVSTAGGLKILRWLAIFRRVREEVRRLSIPRGVFGASFVEIELGVWIHFLVFTFTIGGLTLILTAGGHPFAIAAAGAAGAIANAGPVLHIVDGVQEGYAVFENGALRAALIGGMILGRIEAVVALVVLNRSFWRS